MRARAPLAAVAALALGVAVVPATRAEDPAGGTAVTGEVASILELSLQRGSADVVTAVVTASIPRTQLLAGYPGAAAGSASSVAIGAGAAQPVRPATRLALAGWDHAITRGAVVLRTRVVPRRARASAVLEITAAPQTP